MGYEGFGCQFYASTGADSCWLAKDGEQMHGATSLIKFDSKERWCTAAPTPQRQLSLTSLLHTLWKGSDVPSGDHMKRDCAIDKWKVQKWRMKTTVWSSAARLGFYCKNDDEFESRRCILTPLLLASLHNSNWSLSPPRLRNHLADKMSENSGNSLPKFSNIHRTLNLLKKYEIKKHHKWANLHMTSWKVVSFFSW